MKREEYRRLFTKLSDAGANWSVSVVGTIDTYLVEQRRQVVGLLRSDPGLTVTSIAQVLGVEVQVAQLIVRPLILEELLRTEGERKATKYFIAPAGNQVSQASRFLCRRSLCCSVSSS